MNEKSVAEIYRDALFIITGIVPYCLIAFFSTLLLLRFCPDGHGGIACDWLLPYLIVVCIAGFPVCVYQWHKTGRWFWLTVIPKIVGLP